MGKGWEKGDRKIGKQENASTTLRPPAFLWPS